MGAVAGITGVLAPAPRISCGIDHPHAPVVEEELLLSSLQSTPSDGEHWVGTSAKLEPSGRSSAVLWLY